MPRIGKDLYQTAKISDNKIGELENILLDYKTIVNTYNCSECFVIGTHALRSASNKYEIKERIYKNTALSLEIVSPETEAEYAFFGVRTSGTHDETFAILDIGGGSTEIVICKNGRIIEKKSIPVGVVTLKEQFISGYPISERGKM